MLNPVLYVCVWGLCVCAGVRARVRVGEPAQPARSVRAHSARAPLPALSRALPSALHGQHARQEGTFPAFLPLHSPTALLSYRSTL